MDYCVISFLFWIFTVWDNFWLSHNASHVRSSLTPPCCPINNIQGRRWKIPKENFKWGLTSKSVDCFFLGVLNVDYIFIPSLQMLLIVSPQNLHQSPPNYFCLSICLWMECCRSLQLSVHLLPKCSPKGTNKYGISIWDYSPWYPKAHPNLFKDHDWGVFSLDGVFTSHENAGLTNLSTTTNR